MRKAVFDVYFPFLKNAFGGEPWADIAPFAERISAEFREDGRTTWEEITDRAEAEWRARK